MVSLKRKMSTLIGNILSNPWNYNFQTKPKNPGTTSVGQQRHAIKSRTLPILLTLLTLLTLNFFFSDLCAHDATRCHMMPRCSEWLDICLTRVWGLSCSQLREVRERKE